MKVEKTIGITGDSRIYCYFKDNFVSLEIKDIYANKKKFLENRGFVSYLDLLNFNFDRDLDSNNINTRLVQIIDIQKSSKRREVWKLEHSENYNSIWIEPEKEIYVKKSKLLLEDYGKKFEIKKVKDLDKTDKLIIYLPFMKQWTCTKNWYLTKTAPPAVIYNLVVQHRSQILFYDDSNFVANSFVVHS